MRILVTGASGFLGRHVVDELLRRGHDVRAMVRPAAAVDEVPWADRAEIIRCDLRSGSGLGSAFDGVDALVHLAAATSGDEESQFVNSVVATEKLLDAMSKSATRRLVLAGTFSVYDFSAAGRTLNEDWPLERDLYKRDGYAIAKTWQERVVRRTAEQHGWQLTVLRPGFIWGRGHEYLACLGQQIGKVHLAISPLARIPLTHVENCADCFATATESSRAIGETFNVVDDPDIRAWHYFSEYLKRNRGLRIPVPYWIGLTTAHMAQLVSDWMFKGRGKLPGILVPCRFKARFRPLRYSTAKLAQVLQWRPPLSLEQCLQRTYGEPARALPRAEVAAEAAYA